ncbi:hypothetical protein GLOTRDRAFT_105309 [Gloeophyllum trabeum ATCC 11539]|uniref:tRNA-splicing endonuclease subunit Sen2 n=1 Tax=Gloeophyllum trabeum (strain ATCC 11539 / FP-39264 / Madison 617) TaxID=670483 RepID=S7RPD1_GLOTA|nr:uncharacterized protein GLOTRDRAFT_105309 [Gloeophyllum trabeum ATCC 11539]EPQ56395.1 hypothetical protein GLOTRDRAFT_105309 [Gloeophyllum trabeum ATCC 11539]
MSLITPQSREPGKKKGNFRRNDNNRIYANPLPLVFSPEEKNVWSSHKVLGLFGLAGSRIQNPHCEGVFDAHTRSVWVTNSDYSTTLWRRGFFGKGTLSRSEPSWLARQINARQNAEKNMVSEQVTAKRRAERKQFKLDRARAIAQAAAAAEAAFAEGRILTVEETGIVIPSAATWKPSRPASPPPPAPEPSTPTTQKDPPEDEDIIPENMEHLQLTLQEAFFLAWTLDCLMIVDPDTHAAMSLQQIWQTFQLVHFPLYFSASQELSNLRFDNPFLINYVVYHHYRSLGWVVRSGIKFCVDYLLYKRGPVFHHAEFAIVVCPVYEDEQDRETCPFDLQNVDPFSWTWLSTVNRVNSQVQKTLVLTYVTIPSRSRCHSVLLASPACLQFFTVREVVLRRFIPARMRD